MKENYSKHVAALIKNKIRKYSSLVLLYISLQCSVCRSTVLSSLCFSDNPTDNFRAHYMVMIKLKNVTAAQDARDVPIFSYSSKVYNHFNISVPLHSIVDQLNPVHTP